MNINEIKIGDYYIERIFVKMYNKTFFTTFVVVNLVDSQPKPTIKVKVHRYHLVLKKERGDIITWWDFEFKEMVKIEYEEKGSDING